MSHNGKICVRNDIQGTPENRKPEPYSHLPFGIQSETGEPRYTRLFRERLVLRGFNQEEGVDFEEMFSPVARYDTLRLLLLLCAAKTMHSGQFDIKAAFLHGDLKEDL